MISDEELSTLDAGLVPIREISRVTGVNTVTLRAWERRYGLLVPQRTGKGHRLYSAADIDRVKEIQLWLGRGLAISKVKALLANQPTGSLAEPYGGQDGEEYAEQNAPLIDSHWHQLAQQIHAAITAFQRKSLERLVAETLSLYPATMAADNLFFPLWRDLQGDEPGMAVRRAFFSSVAAGVLADALARQRQALIAAEAGAPMLILSATPDEGALLSQLFEYTLLINQYPVENLGYLNLRDALLGCNALDAKIVVIIGYRSMNAADLQLHLTGWQEKSAIPLMLLGDITIPQRVFDMASFQGVELCSTQQQAITYINNLLKG
jgi:DNA-binding transcriptional MerR regulator